MNNTKKKNNNKLLASIAGATLLLAAQVGVANATPISFSITSGLWALGSGWDAACTGAGCDASHTKVNADWTIAPGVAGKTFLLTDVGDAFMFKFGSAKLAEENRKIDNNERDHLDVTGIINLSAPVTTVENNIAVVIATKGSLNDIATDLSVSFAPIYVDFGNGGQFRVDLSDPVWNCNTGNKDCSLTILGNGNIRDQSVTKVIKATFTLTQLETVFTAEDTGEILAAVPEPGMIALMSLGLAGLGFSRRKKA